MLKIRRGNLGLLIVGALFLVVLGSVWAEAEHHPAEAEQAGLASLIQRNVREAGAGMKRKNAERKKKRKNVTGGRKGAGAEAKKRGGARKKSKNNGARNKRKNAGKGKKGEKKDRRRRKNEKEPKKNKRMKLRNMRNNEKQNHYTIINCPAFYNENDTTNVRDFRYARNQIQKARRAKNRIAKLDKLTEKAATAFLNGATFYKKCSDPGAKAVYEGLRFY